MASQKIKLTDEISAKEWTYKEIEDLMAMAITQGRLADFLKVDQDTVSRQKERDPKFAEAIRRGKRKATQPVTKALMELATEKKDLGAIKYVLNNVEGDEWSEKTKTEVKAEVVNISNILNELEK
jgi:hypothetical protein